MPRWRSTARVALLACGAGLCLVALSMDADWFQRHVIVPASFQPRPRGLHAIYRAIPAVAGLALALASRPLSRLRGGDLVRIAVALLLALAVAEAALRRDRNGTAPWRAAKLELRMGRPDARYGWLLLPSRSSRLASSPTAEVTYDVDAWGDRAADARGAPDPARPTLVVAGESIAVGHGLAFEDTFAARLSSALGLQLVNVAAGGYGTDQALLRVEDALASLSRVLAVVMVVPMLQLERNVQDYRTHLVLANGALALAPPADGLLAWLRLRDLVVNEIPILGEEKLQRALAVTAAELRETAVLARAHGAAPIFLVPVVGPKRPLLEHPEAQFLRPLFIDQGLPFVLADIDPGELLPFDGHPDAAASRRMSAVLEEALRPRLAR